MDKRKRPKATAPYPTMHERTIQARLSAADYRKLYELMMERDTSMAETIRQLIREASP